MNEVEKKEIEEMERVIDNEKVSIYCWDVCDNCSQLEERDKGSDLSCQKLKIVKALYNAGYGKVEDYKKEIFALKTTLEDREHEVRELNKKVERLEQSLSNCAFMTSSIGDLPINSVGLGRAVDEIARLQTVEAELQELNVKYYNEAKDSRRKIEKLKKESSNLRRYNNKLVSERQQSIKECLQSVLKVALTEEFLVYIDKEIYQEIVKKVAEEYGV